MKRHLLGLCFFLISLVGGFVASPIRFSETGRGHGSTADLQTPCYVVAFRSTWLQDVTFWSCTFDDEQRAYDDWRFAGTKYSIISESEGRYLTRYFIDGSI